LELKQATMTTPTSGVCKSGDSTLSTSANILSILTFAYALVAGTLYQIAIYCKEKNDAGPGMQEQIAHYRALISDIRRHGS
jgi:hypothetical protein